MASFEGKTILITGAASGIGQATSVYLDKLGANLILVGRSVESLQETQELLTKEATLCAINLAEIVSIESAIKPIVKQTGPLSGIVHCAGISDNRPLAMFKYDHLHRVMLTNFYSFFEIVRILTKKGMYSENGMSIVAISSIAAKVGNSSQTAYGASKAALNGAMHSMAIELAPKKIRVNTIMPAHVNTKMIQQYYELRKDMGKTNTQPRDRQVLGMCQPESIASVVSFLLSEESAWVTGVEFPVDGGVLSHG